MDHILGLGSSISGHLGHLLRVTLPCTWCADICLRPCFHSLRTFPEVGLLELPASFNHKCVFTSPAPSRTQSSAVTARGWMLVLNRQATGLQRPCRVSGHDPISLCPPFHSAAQLSRQEPTRTCSPPSSTQGPDGSYTVRCPRGSSSSSSHTNPRSMARSPCTVVTGSKVSVHSASGVGSGRGALASADPRALFPRGPLWRYGGLRGRKGDLSGPCGAASATLNIHWKGQLERRQGRAGQGIDRQVLSTPRASGAGGAGIGPSTGQVQTHLGAPGEASGNWFSLGACDIPR